MKLYIKKDVNIDTVDFKNTPVWINPGESDIEEEKLKELVIDIGFIFNVDGVPHTTRFRYLTETDTEFPFYESPCLAINLLAWGMSDGKRVEDTNLANMCDSVTTAVLAKDSTYIKIPKDDPEFKLRKGLSWLTDTGGRFLLVSTVISVTFETTQQVLKGINLDKPYNLRKPLIFIASEKLSYVYPPDLVKDLTECINRFDENGDSKESPKPILH